MITALAQIREKCKTLIIHSSEEQLSGRWIREEEIDMHDLCPSIYSR
ncbi:MAG: hypothetical protein R2824_01320 [Saprospiraceae bacterium]|nr:hypothetical protein [Lewinella sp.]